jgi:hypothetical protein
VGENPQRTKQACPERYRGINTQTLRASAPLRDHFFHAEVAEVRRGAEVFWEKWRESDTRDELPHQNCLLCRFRERFCGAREQGADDDAHSQSKSTDVSGDKLQRKSYIATALK